MRLRNRLLAAALCSGLALSASAEDKGLEDRSSVEHQADAFMDKLHDGRVLAAYDSMQDVLGVESEGFEEQAESARDFFGQVRERVGEPIAYDRVRTSSIKNHFYRLDYLQKFEDAALSWEFTFYRPENKWLLVGVSYSTELNHLYEND